MAEKSDLLLNQALVFGEEEQNNFIQNDPENTNLESKQNYVGQVADLFSGLKLSMNELKKSKEEEMEMYPMTTKSTVSGSRKNQFLFAGKIISVLPNLSTVLVYPAPMQNSLLDVGTNLFIQHSKSDNDTRNCLFFGKLEEVFGNVESPLYAVRLSPENNFPKVEDKVFYSSSDPSTSMFHF